MKSLCSFALMAVSLQVWAQCPMDKPKYWVDVEKPEWHQAPWSADPATCPLQKKQNQGKVTFAHLRPESSEVQEDKRQQPVESDTFIASVKKMTPMEKVLSKTYLSASSQKIEVAQSSFTCQ